MNAKLQADLAPARHLVAHLAEEIDKSVKEWMDLSPEERRAHGRANFIKQMGALGIQGYFRDDADEFVVTEMPRPVTSITVSCTLAPDVIARSKGAQTS